MKKGLVTAFVIASVLAFNACKKEEGPQGPQGPQGEQGPQGATGPQGPVGPAGAAGADGTKILTGTTAPGASTGANGDYYFDSASKTLYGPKAGGAWPAGTSLEGPAGPAGADGADGADGAPGTQFLAGAGVPDAATGNEGDYYFDTNTSTFYGPKSATVGSEWTVNVFPLASAYAAKTFYLSGTLNNVTEVAKVVGQKATVSYPHSGPSDEIQATGVYYNQEDMTRRASYPGWDDNREMIFETDPVGAPGIFDYVPTDGTAATWSAANPVTPLELGRRFRFTQNFANPTAEFNLTAEDIARLTKDGGAFYNQYVYAKVINGVGGRTVAIGEPMYFYRTKHVTVVDDPSTYSAAYTATTSFNLNNIPGLGNKIETYKHDGKVYLKYRYVNPATGAPRFEAAPSTVGWVDLTDYINGYSVAGASYGPDGVYTTTASSTVAGVNPFAVAPYNPRNMAGLASTGALGAAGMTLTVSADNVLTQVNAAPRTQVTNNGQFNFHWDIVSGSNIAGATTAVPFGVITLVNVGGSLDPVGESWVGGTYNTTNLAISHWATRGFADTYYKAPNLTATVNGAAVVPAGAAGTINMVHHANGQPASYFQGKSVVQLQVFVVTGDIVKQAAAAGINVNNPEALSNFANSLRLQ